MPSRKAGAKEADLDQIKQMDFKDPVKELARAAVQNVTRRRGEP